MAGNPLASLTSYSSFVAEILDRPDVEQSTVAVWSESRYTGVAEGEVLFRSGIRLRIREELDFADALITAYGFDLSAPQARPSRHQAQPRRGTRY